jgi:chromosome segregation ATPase
MNPRRTESFPRQKSGFALSCVVAALCCIACDKSSSNDVVTVQSPVSVNEEALRAKVDEAKAQLSAQQKAFTEESRSKLAALDAKIEELKGRANQKGSEAKHAADDALAQLSAQREEARAALQKAEGATREQWQALKGGASDALSKAEAAYNAALQRLKTD